MSEMIAHGNRDHPRTERAISRGLRDVDFVAAAGMPIGVDDGDGFAGEGSVSGGAYDELTQSDCRPFREVSAQPENHCRNSAHLNHNGIGQRI
jgi:hypothetical protein